MPLIFILLLIFSAFPDVVVLKSGVRVDCDVVSKSEEILKVHSLRFQRVMVIERDQIDYIEIDGARKTFEELKLEKTDYNPKFRMSPKAEKRKPVLSPREPLFAKDVFDAAGSANSDSSVQAHRLQNLFFNAPARWGSFGFGYVYAYHLRPPNPSIFSQYGFNYQGGMLNVQQLCGQVRRNFRSGLGALVLDFGYGKRIFELDSIGQIKEAALLRFAAVKYVLCYNRWLLSPGLSGGLMFVNAGVIRYDAQLPGQAAGTEGPALNFSLYNHGLLPVVGIDLNFYDVLDFNISTDLWDVRRFYLNLMFLLPFLQ